MHENVNGTYVCTVIVNAVSVYIWTCYVMHERSMKGKWYIGHSWDWCVMTWLYVYARIYELDGALIFMQIKVYVKGMKIGWICVIW